MKKWTYKTLGHLGTVTTNVDGDEIEAESGTEFYVAQQADARIAEMRKAFETSSTDEENKLRARIAELEQAKAANYTVIEARGRRIDELERAYKSALLVIRQHQEHSAIFLHLAEQVVEEADKVLSP